MSNEEFEATLDETQDEAGRGQGRVGQMGWREQASTRDYPDDPGPVTGLDDTGPSPSTSDQSDPETAFAADADDGTGYPSDTAP